MTMRSLVAFSFVLVLGVAGYFWFSKSTLAFSPDVGDVRYFSFQQTTDIVAPGPYGRNRSRMELSSLLRNEVLSAAGGVTRLESRAAQAVVRQDDQIVLDTDNVPEFSERKQLLVKLLKAGVVDQVARDGRVLESAYGDQEVLDTLIADRYLPEILRLTLQRDISVLSTYQPAFPEGELKVGARWQTETREVAGERLPALQYEISHMDEQSVTLKFRSMDEPDSEQGRSGKSPVYTASGYLQVERSTGWPLRAYSEVAATLTAEGQEVEVSTIARLEQAGIEPAMNFETLKFRAGSALQGFGIDTASPEFTTYYLPPFGPFTAEESLERLDKSMLWFGSEYLDGHAGLEVDLGLEELGLLDFHPVSAVRLLDSDGQELGKEITVDKRYRVQDALVNQSEAPATRYPFLLDGLSDEQLQAIDRLELEVPVTLPDQLITVPFQPGDTEKFVEELGLTLTVDEWGPDRFLLRLSRPEGYLPGDYPLLSTIPLSAEGKPLAGFKMRLTHELFEGPREQYLEEGASTDFWDALELFGAMQARRIMAMPPHEQYGDMWHDVSAPEGHPIEAVMVYLYTTKKDTRTFVAPSAVETLKGGAVVGERTLDAYYTPKLEFTPLNIEDVVLQGVEAGWLNVAAPEGEVNRCDAELEGKPVYQDSPLTFVKNEESDEAIMMFGSRNSTEYPGSHLISERGQRFFYGLDVDVKITCVTDAIVETILVPESGPVNLKKAGTGTLELSDALYQDLVAVQDRFNLRELPVLAFNREGEALQPLEPVRADEDENQAAPRGRQLRFWGEIDTVKYPTGLKRESRLETVSFPPLP